jgi:nucleoside-diphosphate-sugar epimerase
MIPDAIKSHSRVLVTGASGKIGKHVVAELVERGYVVRAITTKPIETIGPIQNGVEWVRFDWHRSSDFIPLVNGCSAVLHLGAELQNIEKMQRSNVEVPEELARASEAIGVTFFCYVSSVAVYGSALSATVTEASPVLTSDRDVRSEYLAVDTLRCYGRTKLAGEQKIRDCAKNVEYVFLRPTVVVEVTDLLELGSWSFVKRAIAGHRHSQQIYVLDVVHAIIWFMEQSLARKSLQPGISVFNLADNSVAENTYANFFRKAYQRSADPRFRIIPLPSIIDELRDSLKFRILPIRHTLGRMRFSTDLLESTGYRHRYGIQVLHERAMDALFAEAVQSSKANRSRPAEFDPR